MDTHKFHFETFIGAGEAFLKRLVTKLNDAGIPANTLKCDHLCFRVATNEEYDFFKEHLSHYGKVLSEANVNGRPIATFRLNLPFDTHQHKVFLIELPSPKKGTSYSTGYEHAEFVLKESFEDFRAVHSQLEFSEGGDPILNPELSLKLGSAMQAKFHYQPLDRVIELEEVKIKDIIFDFDGTLVESREKIYEINRLVFSKALSRDVSLQESIEKFRPDFASLLDAFGVEDPEKRSAAITDWGATSAKFSYALFEGAIETLKSLKDQGFRLHLWTARESGSALKILREHDLEKFFTTLSFATDTDSKPHANSLRFDWQRAAKNSVVVIGDSSSDMIGAKNIKAIAAAALWDPYANKNTLIKTGAELYFSKLTDLLIGAQNWT